VDKQTNIKGYDRGFVHPCSRKLRLLLGVAFVFVALIPAALQGQITAGSINGVVRDPSQSVIAGATITVENIATSATRTAVTSQDGLYNFSQLIPGSYVITVSKAGFATYKQSNISLYRCKPARRLNLTRNLRWDQFPSRWLSPQLLRCSIPKMQTTM
jgi:hypothetical protein